MNQWLLKEPHQYNNGLFINRIWTATLTTTYNTQTHPLWTLTVRPNCFFFTSFIYLNKVRLKWAWLRWTSKMEHVWDRLLSGMSCLSVDADVVVNQLSWVQPLISCISFLKIWTATVDVSTWPIFPSWIETQVQGYYSTLDKHE